MEATTVESPFTQAQATLRTSRRRVVCSQIDADFNYRRRYPKDEMDRMRDNISAVGGLIHAPLVRLKDDGRYQLLVGNKRFRCYVDLFSNEAEIDVDVGEGMSDAEAVTLMMNENSVRSDPSAIEDAEGATRMLGLCNGNREEAAARLGWDRRKLDRRLALMNATQKVRDAYLDDKIGVGHVELLAAFRKDTQDRIVDQCEKAQAYPSLDSFKDFCMKALLSLEHAIFDRTQCNGCQHNTGFQQSMFETAFEGSNCTNRECYDQKTNTELEARKAKLEEDYQVVRIVRAGENATVIALRAEGDNGVGADQAKACRTCGDFGACVSAVPDKLGKGFRDVCFNATCHEQKVGAERKRKAQAERDAQQADATSPASQQESGEATEPQGTTADSPKARTSAPAPAPATSVASLRNAIKEHREVIWRTIFKRAAMKLSVVQSRSLLATILIHRPSYIDAFGARDAINESLGESHFGTGNKTQRILKTMLGFNQGQLVTVFNLLAAHVSKDMPIDELVGCLKALDIKIEDHWRLNETFFEVLTKAEMDGVCEEVGLAAAAGKTYASLKNGSKKDFVAAMLKVSGFKYEGVVPKMMRWD